MSTTQSAPEPPEDPMVQLPAGWGRTNEKLHVIAWRELLRRDPRAVQAIADHAARQTGAAPVAVAGEGASIELAGNCRSDLFVTCTECRGDRIVIEVKGPTAPLNWQKRRGAWQTVVYGGAYQADPGRTCHLTRDDGPVLVLLDARDRARQDIEDTEAAGEPVLDGWAVLAYQEVLSGAPFDGDPVARWLLTSQ
jgi:hypothetical protein